MLSINKMFTAPQLRRASVILGVGISSAYVVANVSSVHSVKNKLELKVGDAAVPVSPKLQSLIDEVKNDMKLNDAECKVTPFISKGSDVTGIGFTGWSSEVFLGIPEYFMFDEDDKGTFAAVVDGQEIPKTSPKFGPLKAAMTLSKEAKKFGMATEICKTQLPYIFPYGVLPMLVTLNSFGLSYFADSLSRASKQPVAPWNHYFIFFFGAWLYLMLFDTTSVLRETESDFKIAELGKSYVEGGIEYYEKMRKRYKVFKELNENAPYTNEGDIKLSMLRMSNMPLRRRLTYLEDINTGKKISQWRYILF